MKLNIPKALREFTSKNIKETEDDTTFLNYLNFYRKYKNFRLLKKTESYEGREYVGNEHPVIQKRNSYIHIKRLTHLEFSCTLDEKELQAINVDYIEAEVPSSIEIGIADLPDINHVVATTSKYPDGSGNRIPTSKIITESARGRMGTLTFFTHNEQTIVRKIGGTPANVSDFLLPFVSQYEAQKAEEEKRREEKEHERLEEEGRRLESAKKDTLAEIERVRKDLSSLKEKIKDAKNYHDVPDVYNCLYPTEEDC
ncbi:MAG: hypothetical protein KAW47_08325 [Thermoplasmatales archaeon]|nr:hypothetical protein [Thermoplasmatales archaeon]